MGPVVATVAARQWKNFLRHHKDWLPPGRSVGLLCGAKVKARTERRATEWSSADHPGAASSVKFIHGDEEKVGPVGWSGSRSVRERNRRRVFVSERGISCVFAAESSETRGVRWCSVDVREETYPRFPLIERHSRSANERMAKCRCTRVEATPWSWPWSWSFTYQYRAEAMDFVGDLAR